MLLKLEMQQLHTKQPCKRCLIHSNLCVLSSFHRFQKTIEPMELRARVAGARLGKTVFGCKVRSEMARAVKELENAAKVAAERPVAYAFIGTGAWWQQLHEFRLLSFQSRQAYNWSPFAECCARIRAQRVGICPSRGGLWVLWSEFFQISSRSKPVCLKMFLQSSTIFYISLQSFTTYYMIYVFFFKDPFHSARSLSFWGLYDCTIVHGYVPG